MFVMKTWFREREPLRRGCKYEYTPLAAPCHVNYEGFCHTLLRTTVSRSGGEILNVRQVKIFQAIVLDKCLFAVYLLQHRADCLKSTSDDHFDIFEGKIASDVKQASLNYDCHWGGDQLLCVRYVEHNHRLESGGSLEK